ncbi:MAG: HD-GYP domain-containing protein, partial [Oscillospiraceae bacterium]
TDGMGHAIYGYLFIKYFSPVAQYARIIRHHHATLAQLPAGYAYNDVIQLLHLADALDLLLQSGIRGEQAYRDFVDANRGHLFSPCIADLFFASGVRPHKTEQDNTQDEGFQYILTQKAFSGEEMEAYLGMTVLSIDFRSSHTVTHTITTTSICKTLAILMNLDNATVEKIQIAAFLHDLGKTAIPLSILEGTHALSPPEYAIMRSHVAVTDEIIRGNVSEDIQKMAVRHHEKLDGSGYPNGLPAHRLTVPERLIAIGDIFSALHSPRSYKRAFPKEKTLAILAGMVRDGLLDGDIVAVAAKNFDYIVKRILQDSSPTLAGYELLSAEHARMAMQKEPAHSIVKPFGP